MAPSEARYKWNSREKTELERWNFGRQKENWEFIETSEPTPLGFEWLGKQEELAYRFMCSNKYCIWSTLLFGRKRTIDSLPLSVSLFLRACNCVFVKDRIRHARIKLSLVLGVFYFEEKKTFHPLSVSLLSLPFFEKYEKILNCVEEYRNYTRRNKKKTKYVEENSIHSR